MDKEDHDVLLVRVRRARDQVLTSVQKGLSIEEIELMSQHAKRKKVSVSKFEAYVQPDMKRKVADNETIVLLVSQNRAARQCHYKRPSLFGMTMNGMKYPLGLALWPLKSLSKCSKVNMSSHTVVSRSLET